MSDEEIQVLQECRAVLDYINAKMNTDYKLTQGDATANNMTLTRGTVMVRQGQLKDINKFISGMIDLAYYIGNAIGRKE